MTKITQARAKNFGLIQDLDLNFELSHLMIVGDNGKGKSTLLNGLQAALTNRGHKEQPLTMGESEGYFEVDVEAEGKKYTIRHIFDENGTQMKLVEHSKKGARKEGRSVNGAELKRLFNVRPEDPFAIFKMTPRNQVDYMLELMGYQKDDLDRQYESLYKEREDAGRNARAAKGAADATGMTIADATDYVSRKNSGELWGKITNIKNVNERRIRGEKVVKELEDRITEIQLDLANDNRYIHDLGVDGKAIEELKAKMKLSVSTEGLDDVITKLDEAIEKSQESIDRSNKELDEKQSNLNKSKKWLEENPHQNAEALEAEAQEVDEYNAKFHNAEIFRKNVEAEKAHQESWNDLDKQMEEIREKKAIILNGLNIPVEGLQIIVSHSTGKLDYCLKYEGLPLKGTDLNTALMLKIGVELLIYKGRTLESSPMIFLEVNDLDNNSFNEVVELCNKNQWTLFAESVAVRQGVESVQILNLNEL